MVLTKQLQLALFASTHTVDQLLFFTWDGFGWFCFQTRGDVSCSNAVMKIKVLGGL